MEAILEQLCAAVAAAPSDRNVGQLISAFELAMTRATRRKMLVAVASCCRALDEAPESAGILELRKLITRAIRDLGKHGRGLDEYDFPHDLVAAACRGAAPLRADILRAILDAITGILGQLRLGQDAPPGAAQVSRAALFTLSALVNAVLEAPERTPSSTAVATELLQLAHVVLDAAAIVGALEASQAKNAATATLNDHEASMSSLRALCLLCAQRLLLSLSRASDGAALTGAAWDALAAHAEVSSAL